MGGGAGEADGVDRLVGVVVVGPDVHVQVGRLHDPQVRLPGLCAGAERVQQAQGHAGGGGAQKAAAGDDVSHRTVSFGLRTLCPRMPRPVQHDGCAGGFKARAVARSRLSGGRRGN